MERKIGHTPEPWEMKRLAVDPCDETECFRITGQGCTLLLHVTPCADGFLEGQNEANARRIVSCINALASVPDPSAFMESYREMRTALEPFAKFAEIRERIPMRGLDDVIYQCHGGTDDEASLRLSDCVRARAALANADKLEGAGK